MKKAFLFSVIFILLFTVLLIFSVFYINMLQMNELNLAQARNITKVAYAMDDVRSDMLDYLQLSVNISSNSTNTILSISDVLPSPYTNPSSALSDYKSFISGTYSTQANLLSPLSSSASWHFDEGSGTAAYDGSGNRNTLTLSGATWNSSGKAGYALSFDGSTAYSEASDSSSVDVNNFTIEAWVISHSSTQTSGGGCAKVIAKNKTTGVCGSTYPYDIQDDCTTNRIMAYIYTSSIYSITGPVWSTFLGWTHVAMTYNGSKLSLYINGTLYNSTDASGTLCTNTMSLLIGGRTAQFFKGTIDEVAIYPRAKSASEIAADALLSTSNQASAISLNTTAFESAPML
ncbi:LamG domain-containing protein, partial [Candidatus Micrarchaeota archaeon]|nr:LamG domain-containing protein [Candidatus Micrarchaeota archaeon]